MNIFGVGGMELGLILILMLVVAGPKRMIQWAYILGQYTAKMRSMWTETVSYLQKEFDDAGVDVQLPKEIPTKANFNQTVIQAMKPLTKSLEEPLQEVNRVKEMAKIDMNGNGKAPAPVESPPSVAPAPPADNKPSSEFGTWSGAAPASTSEDKPE